MRVVETRRFRHAVKRLHANQKRDLDEAVRAIMADTAIGQEKTGDLAGVRVYKFRMVGQLTLLAYVYAVEGDTFTMLDLGTHENFLPRSEKRLNIGMSPAPCRRGVIILCYEKTGTYTRKRGHSAS